MKYDPFYKEIIAGLNGELDAYLFEECVVDLIRRYDGYFAVPILGGQDGGMDGAVADAQGNPYPIVTTTRKQDVIGNLTDNLERYVTNGGQRQQCILAVSKSLTKTEWDNLENRAEELGFPSIQILDQAAIAQRLYHDPKWYKELLHLSGNPSALTVVPRTRRPLLDHDLIGRSDAIDWLRSTQGDRLLVGELGAGKTSLLYQLAKDETLGALFVVSNNRTEIANAIRELKPKILMIDDVHSDSGFLLTMQHMRDEIDPSITLVVACWTGAQDEIKSILHASPQQIHILSRLTQDQMACVLKNTGLVGNYHLINEIIRQAEGLPGLAGTLASLALQGDWKTIHTAEPLSSTILRFYEKRLGGTVRGILACFALGGSFGMSKDTLATELTISPIDLQHILSVLAGGGIVTGVANLPDNVRVRPSALRHVLIDAIFFSGPASLSESLRNRLLEHTPNPKATAVELIRAKARGGDIPASFLQTYIAHLEPRLWDAYQNALSTLSPEASEAYGVQRPVWREYEKIHKVWEEYAWQGRAEATWAMDNFYGNVSLLALPLLHHIPQHAIPKLLTEAIEDDRALNSHSGHPMRLLQDWIQRAYPATVETLRRRGAILHGTRTWLKREGDPATGYKAMLFAMTPHYADMIPEPGSGNASTWQEAFLTDDDLHKLQSLWEEIIECAKEIEVPDWQVFLDTIRDWAYPFRGHSPPEKSLSLMASFAEKMALDIKNTAANHIGVLYKLQHLMQRSYPHLEIFKDDVVATLYPGRPTTGDWEKQEKSWKQAIETLATKWLQLEPQEVIRRLERIEIGLCQEQPRLTPDLCYHLAIATSKPLLWFDLMVPTTLPADTIMPFLQKAIAREPISGKLALRVSFGIERLRGIALQIILTNENVPEDLQQTALGIAGQYTFLVERLLRSGRLPQETAVKLFKHTDKELVGKLAVASWRTDLIEDAEGDIRLLWEKAIIEYCEDDDWLGVIFESETALGLEWLKRRLNDDSFQRFNYSHSVESIMTTATPEDRRKLLAILPDEWFDNDLIASIVDDDYELYELLLQQHNRKSSSLLAPLHRSLDSVWEVFAKLAYRHGHTTEEIAEHTLVRINSVTSYVGKLSDHWKYRVEEFETLAGYEDEVIQEVAAVGRQKCLENYEYWKAREDEEDVYGQDWD